MTPILETTFYKDQTFLKSGCKPRPAWFRAILLYGKTFSGHPEKQCIGANFFRTFGNYSIVLRNVYSADRHKFLRFVKIYALYR